MPILECHSTFNEESETTREEEEEMPDALYDFSPLFAFLKSVGSIKEFN